MKKGENWKICLDFWRHEAKNNYRSNKNNMK